MSGVRGKCVHWLVGTMASEGISNSNKHKFHLRYVEEHHRSSNYCIRITTFFVFIFWGHGARNNGTDRFCDSDHVSSLILKGSQYLIFQDHNLILQFFLWVVDLVPYFAREKESVPKKTTASVHVRTIYLPPALLSSVGFSDEEFPPLFSNKCLHCHGYMKLWPRVHIQRAQIYS